MWFYVFVDWLHLEHLDWRLDPLAALTALFSDYMLAVPVSSGSGSVWPAALVLAPLKPTTHLVWMPFSVISWRGYASG